MGRNCKIISTYFGERHNYPYNSEGTIEMLGDVINHEKSMDHGVDNLDIIFVNHNCDNKEGNNFINSLEGTDVYCGKVRVIHRGWSDGGGVSMGSFDYAFNKLGDEYDYWFFQEDDYKIMRPGYYGVGVELLDNNDLVGFIGYDTAEPNRGRATTLNILKAIAKPLIRWCGYSEYIKKHDEIIDSAAAILRGGNISNSDGGMGLTHKKYLKEVIRYNGKLPHHMIPNPRHDKKFIRYDGDETPGYTTFPIWKFFKYNRYFIWYWLHAILSEIDFTRVYYDIGYEIMGYPNQGDMIYSYKIGRKR
jgi:hypothetical protein